MPHRLLGMGGELILAPDMSKIKAGPMVLEGFAA